MMMDEEKNTDMNEGEEKMNEGEEKMNERGSLTEEEMKKRKKMMDDGTTEGDMPMNEMNE